MKFTLIIKLYTSTYLWAENDFTRSVKTYCEIIGVQNVFFNVFLAMFMGTWG